MKQLKFTRILVTGCQGSDVMQWQSRLKELGLFEAFCGGNFLAKTEYATKLFQTRFIGEGGSFLEITGKVNDQTLWAANHPAPKQQRSHIPIIELPSLPPMRQKVLDLNKKYYAMNIVEKPFGSNLGLMVKLFGSLPKKAWCASYKTHIWREAGIRLEGLKNRHSTTQIYLWAKKWGYFYPIKSKDPRAFLPGNALLWQNGDGTGHISSIEWTAFWNEGYASICNTFGGNEGNRLKHGLRKIMVLRNVFTPESATLVGIVNPFPPNENQWVYPENASIFLSKIEDVGESGTR